VRIFSTPTVMPISLWLSGIWLKMQQKQSKVTIQGFQRTQYRSDQMNRCIVVDFLVPPPNGQLVGQQLSHFSPKLVVTGASGRPLASCIQLTATPDNCRFRKVSAPLEQSLMGLGACKVVTPDKGVTTRPNYRNASRHLCLNRCSGL